MLKDQVVREMQLEECEATNAANKPLHTIHYFGHGGYQYFELTQTF
jgi:hypothetical protein